MRFLSLNYYKIGGKLFLTHNKIVVDKNLLLIDAIDTLKRDVAEGTLPGLDLGTWVGYIVVQLETRNNVGEVTSWESFLLDTTGQNRREKTW